MTRFDSEKFTHTVFAQSGPSGLNDNGTLIGNVDGEWKFSFLDWTGGMKDHT